MLAHVCVLAWRSLLLLLPLESQLTDYLCVRHISLLLFKKWELGGS